LSEAATKAKVARERSGRRAAAAKREQEQRELFARFANPLELLGSHEIDTLAKAEYELEGLSEEFHEKVRSALSVEAVNYEKFARLRQMLAIERSEVKARQKRFEEEERQRKEAEEAERRRQEIAALQGKVKALLGEISASLPVASKTIAGVEVECSEFLVGGDSFNADELLAAAAETEAALKRPAAALQALRDKLEAIEKALCAELPKYLGEEARELKVKFERAEARGTRMSLAVAKARARAKETEAKEERVKEQRQKIAKLEAKYDNDEPDDEDEEDDGEWQS